MAKGNVVLKIAGILLIIFGILNVLWTMQYGFIGAMGFSEMKREVITGLLIFYGLCGILVGFFQIAIGAIAVRQSKKPEHGTRCIVWGAIALILGIFVFVLLKVTSGMIHPDSDFYPTWYGNLIVIISGFVLPVIIIIGGILNKISSKKSGSKAVQVTVPDEAAAVKDVKTDEPEAKVSVSEEAAFVQAAAEEVKAEAKEPEAEHLPVKEAVGEKNTATSRLSYQKAKRLKRNVDPRARRKFER